jgi:hypothetical protein
MFLLAYLIPLQLCFLKEASFIFVMAQTSYLRRRRALEPVACTWLPTSRGTGSSLKALSDTRGRTEFAALNYRFRHVATLNCGVGKLYRLDSAMFRRFFADSSLLHHRLM